MIQYIPLTHGLFAMIDEEDYTLVAPRKWHAAKAARGNDLWYARTNITLPDGRKSLVDMHRFIMVGFLRDRKLMIDHKDGNGLNNTRDNLRRATHSENMRNRRAAHSGKSSRYKGVSLNRQSGRWSAQISVHSSPWRNGEPLQSLGQYDTEAEAAVVYDIAALAHFGEFAHTNFPRGCYNECSQQDI